MATAQNSLQQLKEGIGLEVKSTFLNLQESKKNIAVTEKAIEAGEENLRVNEERYRAQVGTATEVVDATTLLASARLRYYNALFQYNVAWFTLERAMGLGRDEI